MTNDTEKEEPKASIEQAHEAATPVEPRYSCMDSFYEGLSNFNRFFVNIHQRSYAPKIVNVRTLPVTLPGGQRILSIKTEGYGTLRVNDVHLSVNYHANTLFLLPIDEPLSVEIHSWRGRDVIDWSHTNTMSKEEYYIYQGVLFLFPTPHMPTLPSIRQKLHRDFADMFAEKWYVDIPLDELKAHFCTLINNSDIIEQYKLFVRDKEDLHVRDREKLQKLIILPTFDMHDITQELQSLLSIIKDTNPNSEEAL